MDGLMNRFKDRWIDRYIDMYIDGYIYIYIYIYTYIYIYMYIFLIFCSRHSPPQRLASSGRSRRNRGEELPRGTARAARSATR